MTTHFCFADGKPICGADSDEFDNDQYTCARCWRLIKVEGHHKAKDLK